METTHPQKNNVMVECNHEREDVRSSKRFKGSEEINQKKLTDAKVIHVEAAEQDNCNWDNLWVIAYTLLSDIMEDNENEENESIDEEVYDVDVDAMVGL